jgi:RimJ/RimL family protein N-acetyltransferase
MQLVGGSRESANRTLGVDIRPIEASDKDALEAAVEHLSSRSRYRRFLGWIDHLSTSQLVFFTEVNHDDHEALVAIAPESGEIVGVARYIRGPSDPAVAEVAVAVADDWQGRGIGTTLLAKLSDRARSAGIKRFVASCLTENRGAIDVLEEIGPTREAHPGCGLTELTIELYPCAGSESSSARVAGKVAVNFVPSPGDESTSAVPPTSSTRSRTPASP